jgi:hypothetical protein
VDVAVGADEEDVLAVAAKLVAGQGARGDRRHSCNTDIAQRLKQRIHHGLNTVRSAFRNGGNEIQFAIPATVDMLRGSGHKVLASSF